MICFCPLLPKLPFRKCDEKLKNPFLSLSFFGSYGVGEIERQNSLFLTTLASWRIKNNEVIFR